MLIWSKLKTQKLPKVDELMEKIKNKMEDNVNVRSFSEKDKTASIKVEKSTERNAPKKLNDFRSVDDEQKNDFDEFDKNDLTSENTVDLNNHYEF